MYRDCGFEPSSLQALISKRAPRELDERKLPPLTLTALEKQGWASLPVWVSTGPLQAGSPASLRQSLLLRDALGELAHVLFDRPSPIPIMTTWTPSITPGLLEAAARWGGSTGPLVFVFGPPGPLSHSQQTVATSANWTRGQVVEVPQGDSSRSAFLRMSYRCAILLGGGDEVGLDASALRARAARGPKAFAIASTGGEAEASYLASRDSFGGSNPELVLDRPTSYTLLIKRILSIASSPDPGGGTGSHGESGGGTGSAVKEPSIAPNTQQVGTSPSAVSMTTTDAERAALAWLEEHIRSHQKG